MTQADWKRLEYRFRWDRAEHQRMYRALQRETRRGSKVRWALNLWLGFVALVFVFALWHARDGEQARFALQPLAFIGAFYVFDRWGAAYLNARSYARNHAPCLPNDQIRVLDAEGLTAQCTTTNAAVKWVGVVKVTETPEFFLFFTTPNCAIQLPKRAVGDVEELRGWLGRKESADAMKNLQSEPVRR